MMLGTLLKKQLMEIFRGYFYNSKKNEARTKGNTIVMFALFAFLMVVVIGGIFGFLSFSLCPALAEVGMGWLYYIILGIIGLILGTFGSAFNTFTGLYKAKDNDLLLSMPVPVNIIMSSRLLSVYLLGLMYSGCVIVPAVIIYWIFAEFSVMSVLGGIVMLLVVSLIVFVLSCLLGWVIAKISTKLKNKSIVSVLVTLVGIGLYYFVYFRAQTLITEIVTNAASYGGKISGSAKILYLFGRVGEGDITAMLIYIAASALLLFVTWEFLRKTFLGIVTSTGKTSKTVYREGSAKQASVSRALLGKEFRRFTTSANYMLNCGLGLIFLVAAGIAMLIKGSAFLEVLDGVFSEKPGAVTALISAIICMISTMNEMAAPSVSLEGKSIWVVQSMPVEPKKVLFAKLKVQLILNGAATLFCALCCAIICGRTAAEFAIIILESLVCVFLFAEIDTLLAVQMPNLTWTNEITPVKQSGAVAIALFGGWAYALIVGGGFFLIGYKLGLIPYMSIMIAASVIAGVLIHRFISTKGAETFARL